MGYLYIILNHNLLKYYINYILKDAIFRDVYQFCDIYHKFLISLLVLGPVIPDPVLSRSLVSYLTSISFWIFVNPSACAFTKYTPLAACVASQVREYVPASL